MAYSVVPAAIPPGNPAKIHTEIASRILPSISPNFFSENPLECASRITSWNFSTDFLGILKNHKYMLGISNGIPSEVTLEISLGMFKRDNPFASLKNILGVYLEISTGYILKPSQEPLTSVFSKNLFRNSRRNFFRKFLFYFFNNSAGFSFGFLWRILQGLPRNVIFRNFVFGNSSIGNIRMSLGILSNIPLRISNDGFSFSSRNLSRDSYRNAYKDWS